MEGVVNPNQVACVLYFISTTNLKTGSFLSIPVQPSWNRLPTRSKDSREVILGPPIEYSVWSATPRELVMTKESCGLATVMSEPWEGGRAVFGNFII